MTDIFRKEIDKGEFLFNTDKKICCQIEDNIKKLEDFLKRDEMVLLTKTDEDYTYRPRACFQAKSYCLTNGKNVNFSYSINSFGFPFSDEGIYFELALEAEGLSYIPSRMSRVMGKSFCYEGNFSIKMEADTINKSSFEEEQYSTYKTQAISLPIEISYRKEDINKFLENVHYKKEMPHAPDFFSKVIKSFEKHQKNQKLFIWIEKNKFVI